MRIHVVIRSFILSVLLLMAGPAFSAEPVNINTADSATLAAELKGVGESRAKAIVAYRETHGPFAAVEELTEVKGIGNSVLEKNSGRIVIK